MTHRAPLLAFNIFKGNQHWNRGQYTFDGPFDCHHDATVHASDGLRNWSYHMTVSIAEPAEPLFTGKPKAELIDLTDEIVELERENSCA